MCVCVCVHASGKVLSIAPNSEAKSDAGIMHMFRERYGRCYTRRLIENFDVVLIVKGGCEIAPLLYG